jgi:hypothetical protein
MIEKWQEGADVVYGIRTKRKESVLKRAAYRSFYRAFHWLANIDAPLDAGDFPLIDRKVLHLINALPEKNRFFRAGASEKRDPIPSSIRDFDYLLEIRDPHVEIPPDISSKEVGRGQTFTLYRIDKHAPKSP